MTKTSAQPVPARQPRINAINLVRVFVIALVILTHLAASGSLYNSPFSGFVWMVSHVSRFLFVILTALVLTYNYGPGRPFSIKSFYTKRFTLILLPYATWTLIYQLREGLQQHSVIDFLNVYVLNFVTANAMYHLYFLLITMQLYLLFPLLRKLYDKVKAAPFRLLAVSGVIQAIMMSFMQYWPNVPGLEWWLQNPANYVWSYQFYIIAGMVIATHMDAFRTWTTHHFRPILIATVFATVVGFVLYGLQTADGTPPDQVATVFQPYLIVTSTLDALLIFGLGFRWVAGGERFGKVVGAIAEDSFGIYLSHVLFLDYLSDLQPRQNDYLTGIITILIGLPVVYGVAFLFSEIARRTPLSILLTGRHRARFTKSQ